MIREIRSTDKDFHERINEISQMHKDVLYWSILSLFGKDFLKFYYSHALKTNSFFCNVYEHNGKIAGFMTYSTNSKKIIYSILIKKPFRFISILAVSILRKPKNIFFAISSAWFVLFKQGDILPEIRSELIAFAVLPQYKATGVARELFISAIAKLDKLGISETKAMVVSKEDSKKFYLRCAHQTNINLKILGTETLVYRIYVKEVLKNPKINF